MFKKKALRREVRRQTAVAAGKNTFGDERLKFKVDYNKTQTTIELMSPWDFSGLSDETWNKNMPSCMIKK